MKRLISSCYLNPGLLNSSRMLLHVNIQQCTVFICMYIFICPCLYTVVVLLLLLARVDPYALHKYIKYTCLYAQCSTYTVCRRLAQFLVLYSVTLHVHNIM